MLSAFNVRKSFLTSLGLILLVCSPEAWFAVFPCFLLEFVFLTCDMGAQNKTHWRTWTFVCWWEGFSLHQFRVLLISVSGVWHGIISGISLQLWNISDNYVWFSLYSMNCLLNGTFLERVAGVLGVRWISSNVLGRLLSCVKRNE